MTEKIITTVAVLSLWGAACLALSIRRADRDAAESGSEHWWGSE